MTAKLYAALAAAQGEMPPIHKDRTVTVTPTKGRAYEFRYATLETIVAAIRPVLAKHGLGFTQSIKSGEVVTTLFHASGETLQSCMTMTPMLKRVGWGADMSEVSMGPQEAGSLVTYFKRYALQATLGIVADDDTEGDVVEAGAKPEGGDMPAADEEWAAKEWATGAGADRFQAWVKQTMDTADMEFVTDWPNNLDARSRRLLKALEKHHPDKYGAVQAIVAARYDALQAKGAR